MTGALWCEVCCQWRTVGALHHTPKGQDAIICEDCLRYQSREEFRATLEELDRRKDANSVTRTSA